MSSNLTAALPGLAARGPDDLPDPLDRHRARQEAEEEGEREGEREGALAGAGVTPQGVSGAISEIGRDSCLAVECNYNSSGLLCGGPRVSVGLLWRTQKHVLPCSIQLLYIQLFFFSDCVCAVGDNEALSIDPKSVKYFACQGPNQLWPLGVLLLPFPGP